MVMYTMIGVVQGMQPIAVFNYRGGNIKRVKGVSRQFIISLPLILILLRVFNVNLMKVWISFPIADIIAVVIILIFIQKNRKNKLCRSNLNNL